MARRFARGNFDNKPELEAASYEWAIEGARTIYTAFRDRFTLDRYGIIQTGIIRGLKAPATVQPAKTKAIQLGTWQTSLTGPFLPASTTSELPACLSE